MNQVTQMFQPHPIIFLQIHQSIIVLWNPLYGITKMPWWVECAPCNCSTTIVINPANTVKLCPVNVVLIAKVCGMFRFHWFSLYLTFHSTLAQLPMLSWNDFESNRLTERCSVCPKRECDHQIKIGWCYWMNCNHERKNFQRINRTDFLFRIDWSLRAIKSYISSKFIAPKSIQFNEFPINVK